VIVSAATSGSGDTRMSESASESTASPDQMSRGSKIGFVESDRRDKTRKVVVRYVAKHAKYGKYIRRRTVLHVHDEGNESRVGDKVEVAPCRPMSKTKSWQLVRVLHRATA
jgi:small subunit ribosomal protein S17